MPRAKKADGEAKECLMFQKQRLVLQLQNTCGSWASAPAATTRNASSHTGPAAQVSTKPCLARASPGMFREARLLGRESDLLSLQQGTQMSRITGKRKRLVDKASVCVCAYVNILVQTNLLG